MKKTLFWLCIATCLILFVSCSSLASTAKSTVTSNANSLLSSAINSTSKNVADSLHKHTFSKSWTYSDTYHWHAATCGHSSEKADLEEHKFGTEVYQAPTCTSSGFSESVCTVCGYVRHISISETGHRYVPTVIEGELKKKCVICGNVISYHVGDVGPAGGLVVYDKGNNAGGWRFIEAAPADLRVTNGKPSIDQESVAYEVGVPGIIFGYYRQSDYSENYYINGKKAWDINSTNSDIGSGSDNTAKLVARMGNETYTNSAGSSKSAVYAAKMCSELEYRGFSDWFLPSIGELNIFCKLAGTYDYYWSSSEYEVSSESAFATGNTPAQRDSFYKVRPMRTF